MSPVQRFDVPGNGPNWEKRFFPKPPNTGNAWAHYCKWINRRFERFSLEGLLRTQESIDLREIFVPVVLGQSPVSDGATNPEILRDAHLLVDWLKVSNRLIVAGLPGSGKTTLVHQMAIDLASTSENETNKPLRDHLPIPIALRRYDVERIGSIRELIASFFDQEVFATGKTFSLSDLDPFMDQGRFVLFLDGLDEVGPFERRDRVVGWLRAFEEERRRAGLWPGFVVITSRPSGLGVAWREREQVVRHLERTIHASLEELGYGPIFVRPLSDSNIERFCRQWFQLPSVFASDADARAHELVYLLLKDTGRGGELKVLARRPAFLTMMAFVQATVGRLPDTRAQLYEALVDAYLHQLDLLRRLPQDVRRKDWPLEDKRTLLAVLGYLAQAGGAEGGSRRFSWTKTDLETLIGEVLTEEAWRFRALKPEDAAELLSYFLARTGLLSEPEEGLVQFGHLSFQEYLAALYLHAAASVSQNKPEFARKYLFDRLDREEWTEVATLFMAIDSIRTQGGGHNEWLLALDFSNPPEVGWLASLLGGRELYLPPEERATWVGLLLAGAVAHGSEAIGERLVRNVDNRPAVTHWFRTACVPWTQQWLPFERLKSALGASSVDGAVGQRSTLPLPGSSTRRSTLGREGIAELLSSVSETIVSSAGTERTRAHDRQLGTMCAVVAECGAAARVRELEAGDFLKDAELAAAVPPRSSLVRVEPGGFRVGTSFWALDTLVSTGTPLLAEKLAVETHLAVRLLWSSPKDVRTWVVAPVSPLVEEIQDAVLIGHLVFCVSSDRSAWDLMTRLAMTRERVRLVMRDQRLSIADDIVRQAEHVVKDPVGYARALGLELGRALDLLQASVNGAQGMGVKLVRSLRFAIGNARAVVGDLVYSVLGSRREEIDSVLARVQAKIDVADRINATLTDELIYVLMRFAFTCEACLLRKADVLVLTRPVIENARGLLERGPAETSESTRIGVDLRECRERGLLPVEILEYAVGGRVTWSERSSLSAMILQAIQDLDSWERRVPER